MDEKQFLRELDPEFEAFVEQYRRNLTRVYRYHMAHVADAAAAEELTAQTFMTALKELRSLQDERSFTVEALEIAVEKCRRDQRGSRRELPQNAALYYQVSGLPSDRATMQRLEVESVSRALKQIPRAQAEILTLYFFSGLTSAEIGATFRKSADAIETLLWQGLQELRAATSSSPNEETTNHNLETEMLISRLENLAAQITPDLAFESELEQTLVVSYQPKPKRSLTLHKLSSAIGWIGLIGLTFFMLNWRVEPGSPKPRPTITHAPTQAVTKTVMNNSISTSGRQTATPKPTDLPLREYIVQAGDTCTYIANNFGLTIDLLITLNHLNETCDIWADQRLMIPVTPLSTPAN